MGPLRIMSASKAAMRRLPCLWRAFRPFDAHLPWSGAQLAHRPLTDQLSQRQSIERERACGAIMTLFSVVAHFLPNSYVFSTHSLGAACGYARQLFVAALASSVSIPVAQALANE